jgi:indolepyruvate ferredoxin oxidoreductase, beta subunit
MSYDIILAGVGGQGVLSIAAIIAKAAMAQGLKVRQSEVHGMAQRGGAVSAHLRISEEPIASDLVPSGSADMILSMEPLESLRYVSFLKPGGVVVTAGESFVNIPDYPDMAQIVKAIQTAPFSIIVKAAELAKLAGSARSVNMVMVGAASPYSPVGREALEESIAALFGAKDPSLVEVNLKAFASGRAVSESRSNG